MWDKLWISPNLSNNIDSQNCQIDNIWTADFLEKKIKSWIIIKDEKDFDLLQAQLNDYLDFDISNALNMRDDLSKNIFEESLDLIIGYEGYIIKKVWDSLYIYNAIKTNNGENTLMATLEKWGPMVKEKVYSKKEIISDSNLSSIHTVQADLELRSEKELQCENIRTDTLHLVTTEKLKIENLEPDVQKDIVTEESPIQNNTQQDQLEENTSIIEEVSNNNLEVTKEQTETESVAKEQTETKSVTEEQTETKSVTEEQTETESVAKETISYIDYTVKSWDNLWQIMRNEYGLTNPTDIANLLNVLVDGWKSWINDLKATLKIGQKLKLPSEILVKSKSRWDENMKLKTD